MEYVEERLNLGSSEDSPAHERRKRDNGPMINKFVKNTIFSWSAHLTELSAVVQAVYEIYANVLKDWLLAPTIYKIVILTLIDPSWPPPRSSLARQLHLRKAVLYGRKSNEARIATKHG